MLGLLAAGWYLLRPAPPPPAAEHVRFLEMSSVLGCENTHTMCRLAADFDNVMPWLSSVGAAAAAADVNGDGFPDLYVTNSGRGDRNRLFVNRGDSTFEETAERAGVACGNPEGACMHAVFGDIDNDGDLDLYVVKWGEANQLFRNDGDLRFTDISRAAGVDYWGYGNGATFVDYDRDGKLDLLVGNYFAEAVRDPATGQMVRNNLWKPVTTKVMHETFTHARNGGRNVLYRNRGDGTFEDVSLSVGLTTTLWTLAVGAGDLNNDGWPDLYIANDFGPDELYLNTGATESPPRFRAVIDARGHPGVGADWWKGMNVDMGDVNNDGYLDIYVTNILEKRYKTDEGNMLWLNCADAACPGGRGFRNVAQASGTIDGGWGWGAKFGDFDNDGLLDIYAVNGFVTGDSSQNYWFAVQEMVTQTKNQTVDARDWPPMGARDLSGHERGRLFMQRPGVAAANMRRGEGESVPVFVECAEQAGLTDMHNGRGVALADFNLDGRVDIYVANQGAPGMLYVNASNSELTNPRRIEAGGWSLTPLPATILAPQYQHDEVPAPIGPRKYLRLTLIGRPDMPQEIRGRRFASTAGAVGARVSVETSDGGRQIREVQGGMGFAAQSEYAVHFGIPDAGAVARVYVRWPSGREQEFRGDAARALLERPRAALVEGESEVRDR